MVGGSVLIEDCNAQEGSKRWRYKDVLGYCDYGSQNEEREIFGLVKEMV